MRTGKAVTTSSGAATNYSYVYENGMLQKMTRGSRIFEFSYDANGTPVSIKYRSSATATPIYYYYGINSRGDVVALYNSDGSVAAIYTYDAYGKLFSVKTSSGIDITGSTSIANMNPLRYRSYIYDNETGFYYLQTRYYDPTTCRFINADGQLNTDSANGFNQFAYCNNNPVLFLDNKGCRPIVGNSVQKESKIERKLSCAYMNNTKVYTSINQAATDAGKSAATQTSKDNLEHAYATYYIGTIGNTSYYMNGPIIDGEHNSVNPYDDSIIKDNLVALTHSHPYCNGHVPNEFSIIDPQTKKIYGDAYVAYDLKIPVFLAAPNGTLQILFWRGNAMYKGIISEDLPVDNEIFICN